MERERERERERRQNGERERKKEGEVMKGKKDGANMSEKGKVKRARE